MIIPRILQAQNMNDLKGQWGGSEKGGGGGGYSVTYVRPSV